MSLVKSFWLVALVSALCSSVYTETVTTDCTSGEKGLEISNFNLNNCVASPCKLARNINIPISFTITAKKDIGVTRNVTATITFSKGGKSGSLPSTNMCGKIKCPLTVGTVRKFSQTVTLPPNVPSGLYTFRMTIKDGLATLVCTQFGVEIV